VDTSQVKYDKDAPTGLYFKELRTISEFRIQYYRKGSAASRLSANDINEEYLKRVKYLHVTGITPALSESCYETILHAVELAKKKGLKVVFDPNLRLNLWPEENARKVLLELIPHADIVLPGIDEGHFLYNTQDPDDLGKRILQSGAELAIIKTGANGAYYVTEEKSEHVPAATVSEVRDPVGAGDGFCVGFLSGLLDNVVRGNLVGSVVVKVDGDVEGLPDRSELSKYASHIDDVAR
jgi:2-dehydro-3-deoxygluconokinase